MFNGRDVEGVDESVPYPRHHEAHYPRSKTMAERAAWNYEAPRPSMQKTADRFGFWEDVEVH